MADTVIALPKYGSSSGDVVPIRAVSNGDNPETFSIRTSTGTASSIKVAFPQAGVAGGQVVPMATVDLLDGTYALKTN